MEPPKFPEEFMTRHCRKVLEARHWRKVYKAEGTEADDLYFAECAFNPAGSGLACENCDLHLTRPFCGHKTDEKWLPVIEQFYKDLAAYEKWEAAEEEKQNQIKKQEDKFRMECLNNLGENI